MALIPRFNPGSAFRDLRLFFATRQRHEWVFALIAAAITGYIVFAVAHDSYFVRAPQITYVENFPADRTDAQIIADNKQRSKDRHAVQAERRRQFRVLADQLGIEVDKK